jgi:hypothetical protein
MLFEIIQYSVVSLVFISIVHYLISHLTDNLTTPQVRDIVTSTNQQYEAIIKKLENSKKGGGGGNQNVPGEMKDDLKQYLKSLNDTNVSPMNEVQTNTNNANFALQSGPNQKSENSGRQSLQTYDSSDSVFGDYDGDAYSSY